MTALAGIFGRIVEAIRGIANVFVILCFSYMTISVVVQVLGRYVFNFSIAGAIETATLAQVWMVLVGAGITMRRGMHVAIDVVAVLLPVRLARALSVVIALASLWFLGVVIYGSLPLIEVGFIETSPALQIPMWISYVGIPVGAGYFGLEVLLALARRWNDPFGAERSVAEAGG
ncbi:MAG: TRAP transporter small permease [Pseudomonadota bacterium]